MDVARASDQLDALIERRAREKSNANVLREMWAQSDRRFQVKRRLQLNAEWFRYHCHLADVFGRLAEEHAAKAEKLLEIDPRKETA